MKACMNFKDIRFNFEDGLKVYRKGIVNRSDLRTVEDLVYVNNASEPIAKKFISTINIEVLSKGDWKLVEAMDFNRLSEIYNEEKESVEVIETPIVENKKEDVVIPTVEEDIKSITLEDKVGIEENVEVEESTEEIEYSCNDEEVLEEDNQPKDKEFNLNNQHYSFKKKKRH